MFDRDLFDRKTKRLQPQPPQIMMHVCDAGEINGRGCVVILQCPDCGHTTDWLKQRSVTAEQRGRPCPKCNKSARKEAQP